MPIIRRNNSIYAILGTRHCVCIPDIHSQRVTSTKCRINTVVSPDDGHSRLKLVQKRNKHTKNNCAQSWLYLQDYARMHGQQNIKKKTFLHLSISLSVVLKQHIGYRLIHK